MTTRRTKGDFQAVAINVAIVVAYVVTLLLAAML